MVKDLLAQLFTPGGAIIGTLLLLAAGAAGPGIKQGLQGAAEFWRARLGKRNGNGQAKQGDHTGELQKDLRALGPATKQPDAEEVAIVRAALEALTDHVTGKDGLQERLVLVEDSCSRLETKVDALPELLGQKIEAGQKAALRDTAIGAAKIVTNLLRKHGGTVPDRRRGPGEPLAPHLERRRPDPGEKAG